MLGPRDLVAHLDQLILRFLLRGACLSNQRRVFNQRYSHVENTLAQTRRHPVFARQIPVPTRIDCRALFGKTSIAFDGVSHSSSQL